MKSIKSILTIVLSASILTLFAQGNNNSDASQSGVNNNATIDQSGNGNWSDTSNWSTSSAGSGGAGVPLSNHTVIFDGGASGNATIKMIALSDCRKASIRRMHFS